MKVLITGFGPFDKFDKNPAQVVAEHLSDTHEDIKHLILPVVYGQAREELLKELKRSDPYIVISFGLNGTISHINLEEVAVNIRASEVADNNGNIIADTPVVNDGQLAFRSKLPNRELVKKLREEGIPARHSYSAGVYICNEIFYTEMEWAFRYQKKAGFVHIPMASEMIAGKVAFYNTPHMSMDMILKAGDIILNGVMKNLR